MTTNVLPKPEDILWPVTQRTVEAINFNFDLLFRDLRGVSGDVVPVTRGGTNLTSYTTGDLLYASAPTTIGKLSDVATGSVLLSGGVGAAPAYGKVGLTTHVTGVLPIANGGTGQITALAAFDALAPSAAKGDLLVHNGTSSAALAVGADTYVLTADAASPNGVKWAAGGGSPLTTKGDIYVYGAANTRLPIGTDGYVLMADAAQALGMKWADISSYLTQAEADLLYSALGHTHTFDSLSPLTTKGDILAHTGATNTRVAVGTDGWVLTADSASAAGVKWAAAAAGATPHNLLDGSTHPDTAVASASRGKLVVGTASNEWDALALGTDGAFLLADSTVSKGVRWATVSGTPHALLSDTHTDVDTSAPPTRGSLIYGKQSSTAGGDAFFADGAIAGTVPVGTLNPEDYWANGSAPLDIAGAMSGAVPAIKWAVLSLGANNRILKSDGVDIFWGIEGVTGGLPTTTKGDLLTRTTTADERLGVGADGYVLTADSAEATGLKWAAIPDQIPLTTKGDLLTRSGSADARLAVGTNGAVLTAVSGATNGIDWVTALRARVYRTSNVTLTTGVDTTVAFDAEDYDPDAMHSTSVNNSRITIPTGGAGTWFVLAQGSFESTDGGRRCAHIYVNGSRTALSEGYCDANALGFSVQCTAILDLADADYVELVVKQDSGGNEDCYGGGADLTSLTVYRLRKA